MKKRIFVNTLIIGCLIIIFSAFSNTKQGKYYYAFDERIVLLPKKNTLIVKYSESNDKEKKELFIKNSSLNAKIKWRNHRTVEIMTDSEENKLDLLTKLKLKKEVSTCQVFYTLENGTDMGVTDEILLKFSAGVSEQQQKQLHKQFSTKVIKTT